MLCLMPPTPRPTPTESPSEHEPAPACSCGRPAARPGRPYGVPGRLCNPCHLKAKNAHYERVRPIGTCSKCKDRAARRSGIPLGLPGFLCNPCANDWARQIRIEKAKGERVDQVRCSSCGTIGGRPYGRGFVPIRRPGAKYGIPGWICWDCEEDAQLRQLDARDEPGIYLPSVARIYADAAAIRAARSPEAWARAEAEARDAIGRLHRRKQAS